MLSSYDLPSVRYVLNNNGTSSIEGGVYNIAADSDWNGVGSNSELTGNLITVSNQGRSLISGVYDKSENTLTFSGIGLDDNGDGYSAADFNPLWMFVGNQQIGTTDGVSFVSATSTSLVYSFNEANRYDSFENGSYGLFTDYNWNNRGAQQVRWSSNVTVQE